jgi:hypothetical protein
MPEMTPVGNTIIPPDPARGINTLSGILGLQQQRQALQTGQYQQQSAAAAARSNQLAAQGQQENAQFFKNFDFTQHIADDGTTDLDSALTSPDFKSAGPGKTAIMENLLKIKQQQLDNKQALAGLNSSLVSQLGTQIGALAKDPDVVADKTDPTTGVNGARAKVDQYFDNFSKLSPDAARVAKLYQPMIDHVPAGKLASAVQMLQMQAQDVGGQQAQQNPRSGAIDTGGTIYPTVTQPSSGVPQFTGQAIPKTLPPQVINQPVTNAPAQIGGAQGTVPRPIGPPQAGPNNWQPYAGQQQDIEAFRNEVQNVRGEAQQAPLARNINAQILRLTQDAKTGPGSDTWQHVIGAVGAPFGLSPTASYQEVGKFLEKNAIASMQAMGGPPSDSRLDAAAKANGSTSFSPEALRTVTKFNDATTTALDQYRQGIDHTVGMGGNVDYSKLPAYKAAWAKNFDVDVFRVENALRDGDKAELAKIKSELGPERLKALAAKRQNLNALTQGQIPP